MNDNEIIKALECCGSKKGIDSCFNCPLHRKRDCVSELQGHLFDLINRQQAENETLKDLITYQKQEIKEKEQKYNQAVDDMFGLIETTRNEIAEVKSKAIKEFAERLKKLDVNTRMLYSSVVYELGEDDIDNLVKEMTEPVKIEHNSLCETETYVGE